MVRTVIGDETHVEAFVDNLLQSGITLQVGLAIGRSGAESSRDAVFALIPTPQNDGKNPSFLEEESRLSRETDKRKGSKGKNASPSLQIDVDWIGEHARQVSKMLVGGISVMGIYILTNDSTFRNSTATLWHTSKMVAAAINQTDNRLPHEDLLLLHFSYSPRRVSCRSCSFESTFGSTSLRPCEWKLAKILSTLHSFGCSYNFESRIPVFTNKTPKKRLLEVFLSAVSVEASRLQSALATVDGSLATQEKGLVGNTNHEVELFLPYEYGGDVSEGTVAGLAILSGSIRAHAYCFSREPLSRAVEDLKADIVKSLRSRLEILYDEVDQNFQNTSSNDMSPQDSNTTDSLLHPLQMMENVVEYRCKLPRRIFVPWLEGVLVCDYMQEGEAFQDLCDRCKELLAMTKPLDQSNVLEPEDVNANLSERSFWDIASRKSDPEVNLRDQLDRHVVTVKALPSRTAFWSFVVLILSCIVAWYLRKSWR